MAVEVDINNTTIGYACSTLICVAALMADGITAITLSMGVAASLAGVGGYVAGRKRAKRST